MNVSLVHVIKTSKLAALTTCAVFIGYQVALAQTQAAQPIDPAAIHVPAEAGHVVATHVPPATTSSLVTRKTIFHIQDAHSNYEAQQHLAAIVNALATTYGVELVLVEGGIGNVGFSYLRPRAPLAKRKAGAEKLLKEGEISGEEYQDIIAEYPLQLWGIESADLYNANLQTYLATEPTREHLQPLLTQLRESIDRATERIYPPALRAVNTAAAQYDTGELTFAKYLALLDHQLTAAGLSLKTYPALAAFTEAQALEPSLDMVQVQAEQSALLNVLRGKLASDAFNALMAVGREMQSGTRTPLAFYTALQQQTAAAQLPFTAYSHLARYVTHLHLTSRLDPAQLAQELDRCAAQLRMLLVATDPQAKALLQLDQEVTLVARLIALELTPEEYLTFAAQLEHGSLRSRWEPTLRTLTISPMIFAAIPQLEAAIPQVAQFYTIARRRNHKMVEHALQKMDELHVASAILIAGGFHTPNLIKLLNDQGAQVIVIAPTVTQATDERLYHHMLKDKSGIPTTPQTAHVTQ